MDLGDAYAVPGATAGAMAVAQFVKVLWATARPAQIRVVAALSGLGIVLAVQWEDISAGSIVGLILSGVVAGLAASATFDLGKAVKAAKAANGSTP